MQKYLVTATAALMVIFSATAVQALSVDVTGNTSVNVGANAPVVSAEVPVSVSVGISSQTNTNVGATPLLITHVSATSSASTSAKVHVIALSAVRTNTDLSSYASALVNTDANATSAQLSTTSVSLSYIQQAELFGLIPVSVPATAQVNADGTVSVIYPWYAAFASTNADTLKSDIQAATEPTLKASAGANFSASIQAQLLAEIRDAMKTDLDASLAAQANAATYVQ